MGKRRPALMYKVGMCLRCKEREVAEEKGSVYCWNCRRDEARNHMIGPIFGHGGWC